MSVCCPCMNCEIFWKRCLILHAFSIQQMNRAHDVRSLSIWICLYTHYFEACDIGSLLLLLLLLHAKHTPGIMYNTEHDIRLSGLVQIKIVLVSCVCAKHFPNIRLVVLLLLLLPPTFSRFQNGCAQALCSMYVSHSVTRISLVFTIAG